MKDLTQGSIVSHIAVMAPQIFAGMIMMMLCGLIDLYFVAGRVMRRLPASALPAMPAS